MRTDVSNPSRLCTNRHLERASYPPVISEVDTRMSGQEGCLYREKPCRAIHFVPSDRYDALKQPLTGCLQESEHISRHEPNHRNTSKTDAKSSLFCRHPPSLSQTVGPGLLDDTDPFPSFKPPPPPRGCCKSWPLSPTHPEFNGGTKSPKECPFEMSSRLRSKLRKGTPPDDSPHPFPPGKKC